MLSICYIKSGLRLIMYMPYLLLYWIAQVLPPLKVTVEKVAEMYGCQGEVYAMTFSPKGSLLATTGEEDGSLVCVHVSFSETD